MQQNSQYAYISTPTPGGAGCACLVYCRALRLLYLVLYEALVIYQGEQHMHASGAPHLSFVSLLRYLRFARPDTNQVPAVVL